MLLVLDANEYIFALGPTRVPASFELLTLCLKRYPSIRIRLARTILNEVRRNLTDRAFRELIVFISPVIPIEEDFFVPFELGIKYDAKGLKPADAFIAAYAEWVGADALVTENRHFLMRRSDLPFKVLTAELCLKLIAHSS